MTETDAAARPGTIEVDQFVDAAPARVWQTLTEPGLLEPGAHAAGRAVLTDRGRLLADALVRDLTD